MLKRTAGNWGEPYLPSNPLGGEGTVIQRIGGEEAQAHFAQILGYTATCM
jgi:hypothetical protein